MMAAGPNRQQMLAQAFEGPGFTMRQKNSECCRCCCCQPNMEWTVHEYREKLQINEQLPTRYSIFESATWCGRTCSFCVPGARSTIYRMYQGDVQNIPEQLVNQPVLLTHEKDATCGSNMFLFSGQDGGQVRIPCCCCLPYLTTRDSDGHILGTTKQVCNPCIFVCKFAVENANGDRRYYIYPDTMCCGLCVKCNCEGEGAKCCTIPYYIRRLDYSKVDDAKIVDLWAGFKKEACTRQNHYQVKFPQQADLATRATLQGAALMLDLIVFEQNQS